MISLLSGQEKRFKDCFYYWAAFTTYGFAGAKLEEAVLDQIHSHLEEEQQRQSETLDQGENTIEGMGTTLASRIYHEIEETELTLSRQRCQEYELLD